MAGIFISYRREDSAPWAGRVYERLTKEFKADHVFMDVDNIAPGLDFTRELEQQVGTCEVLLAIIGKRWVDARNAKGERRLDDPHDFVRIELQAALERDIRVVPVLVDGASMPLNDELPAPLQSLTRRNAIELTHARFGSDVQRLMATVKPLVPPAVAITQTVVTHEWPITTMILLGLANLATTMYVVVDQTALFTNLPRKLTEGDFSSLTYPGIITISLLLGWSTWIRQVRRLVRSGS